MRQAQVFATNALLSHILTPPSLNVHQMERSCFLITQHLYKEGEGATLLIY